MAIYTTLLKTYCESLTKHEYTRPRDIIHHAAPLIFDFPYPFYSEAKRTDFQERFVRHFFLREIGSETPEMFKLYLEDELPMVLEKYNPMLKLLETDIDWLTTERWKQHTSNDNTLHTVNEKNATEDKDRKYHRGEQTTDNFEADETYARDMTVDSTARTNSTTDTTAHTSAQEDTEGTSHDLQVTQNTTSHTDTPQGDLDAFLAGKYLSSADHLNGSVSTDGQTTGRLGSSADSSGNTTGQSTTTSNATTAIDDKTRKEEDRYVNTTQDDTESHDNKYHDDFNQFHTDDLDEWIAHKGYHGMTPAEIIAQYLEKIQSIYKLIFQELEILFMEVY